MADRARSLFGCRAFCFRAAKEPAMARRRTEDQADEPTADELRQLLKLYANATRGFSISRADLLLRFEAG